MYLCNLQLDITQRDWLRNSGWDRDKENMILVHGYAGSEDGLPMSVLRDGKKKIFVNSLNLSGKKYDYFLIKFYYYYLSGDFIFRHRSTKI